MSFAWVNYSHPDDQANSQNKRTVASHIGTHHRNRSKPATRKHATGNALVRRTSPTQSSKSSDTEKAGKKTTVPSKPAVAPDLKLAIASFRPRSLSLNSVNLSPEQEIILQYFRDNSLKALFRDELILRFEQPLEVHRHYQAIIQALNNALQDELHMNAVVAATATRMAVLFPKQESFKIQASNSMTKAITQLRKAFAQYQGSKVIDSALLHDVLELSIAAFYLDDLNAAKIHLQALRAVLPEFEADDELGLFVDETARLLDVYIALETGTAPLFDLDWELPDVDTATQPDVFVEQTQTITTQSLQAQLALSPRHYFTSEELRSELTQELPTYRWMRLYPEPIRQHIFEGSTMSLLAQHGLGRAISLGIFSHAVQDTFRVHEYHYERTAEIIIKAENILPKLGWINLKGLAVLYRFCLHEAVLSSPAYDQSQVYFLDVPALLALQLQNSTCHLPLLSRTVQKVMIRLKIKLMQLFSHQRLFLTHQESVPLSPLVNCSSPEVRVAYQRTLFWILFTGLWAALYGSRTDVKWFAQRLLVVARTMGLRDFYSIANIVSSYSCHGHKEVIENLVDLIHDEIDIDKFGERLEMKRTALP